MLSVPHIPSTYLSYNWNFVLFDQLHSFFSVLIPCLWQSPICFLYFLDYICEIIQNVIFILLYWLPLAYCSQRIPLVAQLVMNLPAMWETWVRSLSWEDPPGKGNGYPFQYSGLENSMDCIVHGFSKSWTWLNDFHFMSLHCPQNPSLL